MLQYTSTMSRIANDAYYTPSDVARACVKALEPLIAYRASVFEPHAGGGAFFDELFFQRPDLALRVNDIDPDAPALESARLRKVPATTGSFLGIADKVNWVVGNPPYMDAQAHVEHALSIATDGVAFLLRLSFLESVRRNPFWLSHPPYQVHVLSKRPSFTGGATDSAAYAFFIWQHRRPQAPPTLHWIAP